jgi:hypothetical protein
VQGQGFAPKRAIGAEGETVFLSYIAARCACRIKYMGEKKGNTLIDGERKHRNGIDSYAIN